MIRAALSIMGILSMATSVFILMAEFCSIKSGCAAAILIIGTGLYIDSLTGTSNPVEEKN
jgi:predicted tellurium resistance membrane protein TerC